LRQKKSYKAICRRISEQKLVFPSSMNDVWKKIARTGTVDHKPGSGLQSRTVLNVDAVKELVLSQENAPRTHRLSSDMRLRTRRTRWCGWCACVIVALMFGSIFFVIVSWKFGTVCLQHRRTLQAYVSLTH